MADYISFAAFLITAIKVMRILLHAVRKLLENDNICGNMSYVTNTESMHQIHNNVIFATTESEAKTA